MWLYDNAAPGFPLVHVPAEAERPSLRGDEVAAVLSRVLRVAPSAAAAAAAAAGGRLPSADVFNRASANVLFSAEGVAEPESFGFHSGARFSLTLQDEQREAANVTTSSSEGAREIEGEEDEDGEEEGAGAMAALRASLAELPAAVSGGGARVARIAWDGRSGTFRDEKGSTWLAAPEVMAAVAAAEGSADAEAGVPCLREAALLRALPARWTEQQRRWGSPRAENQGQPDLLLLRLGGVAAARRAHGAGSAAHRAAERVLGDAVRATLRTLTAARSSDANAALGAGSDAHTMLTAQLLAVRGVGREEEQQPEGGEGEQQQEPEAAAAVLVGARRLLAVEQAGAAISAPGMPGIGAGGGTRRRLKDTAGSGIPRLEPSGSSWYANAKCGDGVANGAFADGGGFPDPAAVNNGCPPTTADIASYQVGLWTSVALIGVLYLALAALFDMDVGKDPLLYARFSVGGGSAL